MWISNNIIGVIAVLDWILMDVICNLCRTVSLFNLIDNINWQQYIIICKNMDLELLGYSTQIADEFRHIDFFHFSPHVQVHN